MTDGELVEAYHGWRRQLSAWSDLAAPRVRDGGCSARGTGRALRNVEMIEAIARRRGISLRVSHGEGVVPDALTG
jgi:hypothetical protein